MRCLCCNKNLNDAESTARHIETNDFLDICFSCCKDVGITPMVRPDLEDVYDDADFIEEEQWREAQEEDEDD